MKEVKEGEVYRHFKGPFYYVICVGLDSETRERMVVYKHLDGSNMICVRPEKMFLEEIPERPDNVTGQKVRFELIENLKDSIEQATQHVGIKDYKTVLQEKLQVNGNVKIVYEIIHESGPDHDKRFEAQVSCDGRILAKGKEKSKKEAEMQAAQHALEL